MNKYIDNGAEILGMEKPIKYIYYILSPYSEDRIKELNEYYDNKFELIQKKYNCI